MKSKLLKIVIMSALFLLPATVWGQINTNVLSSSSGYKERVQPQKGQVIPLEVYDGSYLFEDKQSISSIRNQISETAFAEKVEDGYEVTLRIASYDLLDMIQIVKEDKVSEVLDKSNQVTGGEFWKLPAPDFGPFKGGEERYEAWISEGEVDEEYNDYYYPVDQIKKDPKADPVMAGGTVTMKVKDLNTPILIKTYSNLYGKVADDEEEYPVNQIVSLKPDSAIEVLPSKEGTYSWGIRWMGYKMYEETYTNSHTRVSQAGADNFFAQAFLNPVSVTIDGDGKILAVLTVNQEKSDSDDEIVKIEQMTGRDISDQKNLTRKEITPFLKEYDAKYKNIEIKDGQVTIPVHDLIYGQGIRITTKGLEKKNEGKDPDKQQYHYGFLHLWSEEKQEQADYLDPATGITISYYKSDFENGEPGIRVTEAADYLPEATWNSYVDFARDSRVYTFQITDRSGEKINTVNPVEKTIPIPQDWNIQTMRIFRLGADRASAEFTPEPYLNEERNALVFSDNTIGGNNCTLVIYDAGEAQRAEGLEDGLYKTKVGIGHKDDPLRVSLSNVAFAGKEAYVEVKNGAATLYTDVGSASFGTQSGYLSNMFYLDGTPEQNRQEVEYLSFGTEENGEVRVTTDGRQFMVFDVERVAFPLENPTKDNTYWVSFFIPAMDMIAGGQPGSGKSAQSAQLRLSHMEKVESGDNPIQDYEESAVAAHAKRLEFSAENSSWNSNRAQYALRISQETKERLENGTLTADNQDGVSHALHVLKYAADSTGLENGIYQIPLIEEGDWEGFYTPVELSVNDGTMQIQLETSAQTVINEVSYRSDYGENQTDADRSQGGTKISFSLPYTEAPVEVIINGTKRMLALDFAHAERKNGDISALKNLLEKAGELLEDDSLYTTGTKQTLIEEVKKSEALLKVFDAKEEDINAQVEQLQKAINGISLKASLAPLKKELVLAIKASKNSAYHETSRKELGRMIAEIQKQIEDEDNVSKEEAETYLSRLQQEMAALEGGNNGGNHEDTGSLESFLEDYDSWFRERDYTEESWELFDQTKQEVKRLLSGSDRTDDEEQRAIGQLLEARNKLVKDTGTRSQMASLFERLQEAEDQSSEYAGLITYPELEASMEAAKAAMEEPYYLTAQEIRLLEKSLDAHQKACEAEADGEEETQGTRFDIPQMEFSELPGLEEEKIISTPKETVPVKEPEETVSEKAADEESEPETDTEVETEPQTESETDTYPEPEIEAEEPSKPQTGYELETEQKTEQERPIASISKNPVFWLAASNSSGSEKDGTYSIDYDLWKYNEDKPSMGNPALDYGTEPGKIIRKNGKWMLYVHFNSIKFGTFEGSLRTMKKMVDIKDNGDGIVYKTQKAEYPKEVSESPSVLGFAVTPKTGEQYTWLPVEITVEVPGMALGAQTARLRVDWDSLEYRNGSTDIDSSLNLENLNKAIEKAEKLRSKQSDYTAFSWNVLIQSIEAGKEIKASDTATQKMADAQVKAIEASIEALIKRANDKEMSELSNGLMEAYLADESDYSVNAWKELERARTFAEELQEKSDVTGGMVKQALLDLKEALARTGGGSGNSDSGLRTSVLERFIALTEKEKREAYTTESFQTLQKELKAAKALLIEAGKNQCTQADIEEQLSLLKEAYNGLKKIEKKEESAVNYKYLKAMVSRSKEFLALSSKYTDESMRRLMLEYDIAVQMLNDSHTSQEEVEEQKENLRSAIGSLVLIVSDSSGDAKEKESGGNKNKKDRKDGFYKVKVRLWHSSMDKASLGESAIMPTAYVRIEDGEVTMRLQTKKMSLQGITAHLHDFYIYDGGDYISTELISTEDNKWIFEFDLPDDDSKYYKCQVDPQVDVMGKDPVKARLKVDWKSLSKTKEDDWNKLSGDVDEKEDTSSKKTSSASSGPEIVNAETGIRVRGNAGGPLLTVEASKKTQGTEYEKAQAALKEHASQFILYDIKLKSGSEYVQPKETVTLRIPVPAGFDPEKTLLYRLNEEGVKEEISGRVNGAYYEANVDHFSLYALAESTAVLKKASSLSEQAKETASAKGRTGSSLKTAGLKKAGKRADRKVDKKQAGRTIPYTGDKTPVKGLMGAGIIAAVTAFGVAITSRKPEEDQ